MRSFMELHMYVLETGYSSVVGAYPLPLLFLPHNSPAVGHLALTSCVACTVGVLLGMSPCADVQSLWLVVCTGISLQYIHTFTQLELLTRLQNHSYPFTYIVLVRHLISHIVAIQGSVLNSSVAPKLTIRLVLAPPAAGSRPLSHGPG